MRLKTTWTLLSVAAPLAIAFAAYSSCDRLPLSEETTSENKMGGDDADVKEDIPPPKGAVCEDLIEMESYPVQYRQKCVVSDACTETVEISVAPGGNPSTLKVTKVESQEAVTFEFDAEKKAVLIAKEHCPAPGDRQD